MEILYFSRGTDAVPDKSLDIRRLGAEDCEIFDHHLELCGQRSVGQSVWNEIIDEGTMYCGLFADGVMVSRACVEKYSANAWEVGDVRTVKSYRCGGFAYQICLFALKYVLSQGRTATIRTEEDNFAMQRVICRLGFEKI